MNAKMPIITNFRFGINDVTLNIKDHVACEKFQLSLSVVLREQL